MKGIICGIKKSSFRAGPQGLKSLTCQIGESCLCPYMSKLLYKLLQKSDILTKNWKKWEVCI